MKKTKTLALFGLSTLMIMAGCSSGGSTPAQGSSSDAGTSAAVASTSIAAPTAKEAKQVKLTVMTNATGNTFDAIQAVINGFTKENPNIQVDFSTQGKDYEQLMKAKMASNDLPDLFATHGWSVNRYSEYLRPLNDQEWFARIGDTTKPAISDKQGNIYVLPLNIDQSGIVYNKKVLKDLNLEVPKTWEELLNSFKVIKNANITPIHIGGKDTTKLAGFFNKIAPIFLVTDKANNYGDSLKDGSFDWSKWNIVSQKLVDLKNEGYLNKDVVTADPLSAAEKLATGKAAFLFENNAIVAEALKINPEAQIGMMPVPAYYKGDEPVLNGGEREAFGVWKQSKNVNEALLLLKYMAKSDNIAKVAEATGMPAGLKDVSYNLGNLTADFTKYKDLRTIPVFDREYLPNGMWSTLKTIGPALLTGDMSVEESSRMMSDDYKKLRSQK
ncbi:ABC transporter substrate-binding protein [Paenibacillus agricola]|uniref:Extracellular solute-binding protein n=1 Tax=Paenibacillus agricola TaxID=2716264 RepID=A0ABX0JE17_9BACL|nr:extracellular solute-binding protein [Paenibacillus agricola]NHN33640.1 extracellular solute-binding protein [Paenibacillus agricola]